MNKILFSFILLLSIQGFSKTKVSDQLSFVKKLQVEASAQDENPCPHEPLLTRTKSVLMAYESRLVNSNVVENSQLSYACNNLRESIRTENIAKELQSVAAATFFRYCGLDMPEEIFKAATCSSAMYPY